MDSLFRRETGYLRSVKYTYAGDEDGCEEVRLFTFQERGIKSI